MNKLVVLGLIVFLTACSCPRTLQEYNELQTQIEYVDDIIIGNFPTPLPDTLQWSTVMAYLNVNERITFDMFENYHFEFLVAGDSYLLLVRDPCDCRLIMYDFSCTEGSVDGPLYKSSAQSSLRDIVKPDCDREVKYLENLN
jgi:hypothetical protein